MLHIPPHICIACPNWEGIRSTDNRANMTSAISASLLQTHITCTRRSITSALPRAFKSQSVPALRQVSSGWSRRRSTAPARVVAMVSGKLRHRCAYKNADKVASACIACACLGRLLPSISLWLPGLCSGPDPVALHYIQWLNCFCSASLDANSEVQDQRGGGHRLASACPRLPCRLRSSCREGKRCRAEERSRQVRQPGRKSC